MLAGLQHRIEFENLERLRELVSAAAALICDTDKFSADRQNQPLRMQAGESQPLGWGSRRCLPGAVGDWGIYQQGVQKWGFEFCFRREV